MQQRVDVVGRSHHLALRAAWKAIKSDVARNASYSLLGQIGVLAGSTLTAILTARWMGSSGRGDFAIATALIALMSTICLLGVGLSSPSFVARGLLSRKRAFKYAVALSGLGVVATLAVLATSGDLIHFRADFVTGAMLCMAVTGLMMSSIQSSVAIGIGKLSASAANGATTALATAVGIALFLPRMPSHAQLTAVLAVWALGQWLGDGAGWYLTWRAREAKATGRVNTAHLLRFSLTLLPGTIIGTLGFRFDIVVLALLAGSAATGVYSMAVVAGSVVGVLSAAVSQAVVRRLGNATPREASVLLRKAVMVTLVLSTGASTVGFIGLLLFAVPLLGESFADVPLLFAVMAPGVVLFAPVSVLVTYAITVLVWPAVATIVVFFWTAADMLLLLWLAPTMGAGGAAIASSVSYALGAVFMVAMLKLHARRGPAQ